MKHFIATDPKSLFILAAHSLMCACACVSLYECACEFVSFLSSLVIAAQLSHYGGNLVYVYDSVIVSFLLLLIIGFRRPLSRNLRGRGCMCLAIARHRDSAISLTSSARVGANA